MSGRHLLLLVALAAGACSSAPAPALDLSTVDLGGVDAGADAAPLVYQGPLFRRRAEAGELALFERDEVVVNGSGELELRPGGGHPEQDPFAAGSYHGGNHHNGGSYRVGTARSPSPPGS